MYVCLQLGITFFFIVFIVSFTHTAIMFLQPTRKINSCTQFGFISSYRNVCVTNGSLSVSVCHLPVSKSFRLFPFSNYSFYPSSCTLTVEPQPAKCLMLWVADVFVSVLLFSLLLVSSSCVSYCRDCKYLLRDFFPFRTFVCMFSFTSFVYISTLTLGLQAGVLDFSVLVLLIVLFFLFFFVNYYSACFRNLPITHSV